MGRDGVRGVIYITGCAKSGTTLLCRLFYAFSNTDVVDHEVNFNAMMQMLGSHPPKTVCKRARMTPFGWNFSDDDMAVILAGFKKFDVKIVNILRDGRDVVTSDSPVSATRWIASVRQAIEWKDFIDVQVRYEDICRNPNKVQQKVANKLGLDIMHLWSTYPKFVPEEAFTSEYEGHNYKPRPIDTTSIGKDLQAYKSKCRHVLTAFEDALVGAGYEK